MNPTKRSQFGLWLALILIGVWALVRFCILSTGVDILVLVFDAPLWIVIGFLFRSISTVIHEPLADEMRQLKTKSVQARLQKYNGWGLLLGWILMAMLWFIPIWFPKLSLKDYGIEINLTKATAMLWAGSAFLVGYHFDVVWKVPLAVWEKIKTTEKITDFFRGLGDMLSGR